MAGRLKKSDVEKRDANERLLFGLGTIVVHLEAAQLRTRQAMRRSNQVVDLLEPSLEHLVQAIAIAKTAQNLIKGD
jgi:hypothetical protein